MEGHCTFSLVSSQKGISSPSSFLSKDICHWTFYKSFRPKDSCTTRKAEVAREKAHFRRKDRGSILIKYCGQAPKFSFLTLWHHYALQMSVYKTLSGHFHVDAEPQIPHYLPLCKVAAHIFHINNTEMAPLESFDPSVFLFKSRILIGIHVSARKMKQDGCQVYLWSP